MNTWQELANHEPRLQHLCDAAVGLAEAGEDPETVYTAVKPFVDFLVGLRRGNKRAIDDSRRRWREFDYRFKPVLRLPPREISASQEAVLELQYSRDLAVAHIYDRVCAAYDRRRVA